MTEKDTTAGTSISNSYVEQVIVINSFGLEQTSVVEDDKDAEVMTPEEQLQNLLNHSIDWKITCGFQLGDTCIPKEEKFPDLRLWNLYEHKESLTRKASEADLRRILTSGTIVGLADLFLNNARFVAVLGGPGSGKTTFLHRYGRKVLDGEIEEMKSVSIVYLIDAYRLSEITRETTFWDFLFVGRCISAEAKEWMKAKTNQHRILILIDGLQDFNKDGALEKQHRGIGYDHEARPSTIMSGLLQGELLPCAKILATSRSYGIQNFHQRLRPQNTVKLAGFTEENTRYLFKEIAGPEVAKRWERFSDRLKSLCSNPLYLVYVTYMQKNKANVDVDSVSSIMLGLIQNFCFRNDWLRHSEAFKDLKTLCLEMSKKGRVVFSSSELPLSLNTEKVKNLLLAIPEKKPGIVEQPKNRSFFFFSNLLIQESFACLALLDLPFLEYADILKRRVESPFRNIQILACGFLLNDGDHFEELLGDITDKVEKTKLLLKTLELKESANLSAVNMLHHLECLHEVATDCEESIFPNAVDLSLQDLTRCTTHIIAPSIARCKNLVKLVLRRCVLDDRKTKILWKSLRDSSTKIQSFDIGENPDISPSGLKTVAKIVSHCQILCLALENNKLTANHMIEFLIELRRYGTKGIKLVELALMYNPDIGEDGLEAIAGIVDTAKIQVLNVGYCAVSVEGIKKMMGYDLASLRELHLSGFEKSINASRMAVVGERVATNSTLKLHIDHYHLTEVDVVNLCQVLSSHKIKLESINFKGNSDIVTSKKSIRALDIANLGVKIDLDDCGFSEEVKESINTRHSECTDSHQKPKRCKRN